MSSSPTLMTGPTPVSPWSPIALCERGWIPDVLARAGMRRLMRERLDLENARGPEGVNERVRRMISGLRESPIAIETQAANAQHYEVPAGFFHAHLGPRLKYSCCLYPGGGDLGGGAQAQGGESREDLLQAHHPDDRSEDVV